MSTSCKKRLFGLFFIIGTLACCKSQYSGSSVSFTGSALPDIVTELVIEHPADYFTSSGPHHDKSGSACEASSAAGNFPFAGLHYQNLSCIIIRQSGDIRFPNPAIAHIHRCAIGSISSDPVFPC